MRNLKKAIGVFVMGVSLSFLPVVHAEIRTYEGTGEYIMSDFETPDIAKQRAKVRAEQSAVEQAGVYVSSYTKMVNHVVKADEVTAIANNIIKVIDEKYTITPTNEAGGSFRVQVWIKANVDSDKIDNWLKREHQQNIELIEQNNKLREERDKQDKEIQNLRNQLSTVKNIQDKQKLEVKIVNEDKNFLSLQKTEEGDRLVSEHKYGEAIDKYSLAIKLNPRNNYAYLHRGNTYYIQKNYQQAISDYSKTIEINPKDSKAYYNRGIIYSEQSRFQQAVFDYSKAIEINGNFAAAYHNRGNAYQSMKDYQHAISDYTRALEINPNKDESYLNRGNTYAMQKNYQQAIFDYTKAIEVNPRNINAIFVRGNAYYLQGKYQQAINDYNKLISMNVNDNYMKPRMYYYRGLAYKNMGDMIRANKDFAMAKSLM